MRRIVIDTADPGKAWLMQRELDEKIGSMHDLEDGIKKMQTSGEQGVLCFARPLHTSLRSAGFSRFASEFGISRPFYKN